MKVKKGEIFVGDSFTWCGKKGVVMSINHEYVKVGFDYTSKKGYGMTVKLYFDAKKS